jgi:hypothetical protein
MKRPAFQFYPSDWLRDTALRSCSTGARGLWIDMICYMHEGNPYGHLKVGDKVILSANLARMVGETLEVVEGWLEELRHAGVYDTAEDGSIYSRRMIRDENLRQIRANGGKLGGNPNLKPKDKVNLEDNQKVVQEVKQKPTPSSSSSSSSSTRDRATKGSRLSADFVLPEDWVAFCQQHRPDLKPAVVFDGFKDYWVSKTGSAATKLDWTATWRNWVRNQRQEKPSFADVVRSTVPGSMERDPALVKLDEDRKKVAPPSPEILARLRAVKGG